MKNEKQFEETPSTKEFTLRTTNANDFLTTDDKKQIFPDGIEVCKVKLPRNVEFAKREKLLYSIGITILSLNEGLTEDIMYNYLSSINAIKNVIAVPLLSSSIKKIVSTIYDKLDKEGELIPIPNHTRKIIFNDIYNLSTEEKRKITNEEMAKLKQAKTKQTIKKAIEGWDLDEKITIKKIVPIVGMSERTVKTYWPEFKDYVKTKNQEIKGIIQSTINEVGIIVEELMIDVSTFGISENTDDDLNLIDKFRTHLQRYTNRSSHTKAEIELGLEQFQYETPMNENLYNQIIEKLKTK